MPSGARGNLRPRTSFFSLKALAGKKPHDRADLNKLAAAASIADLGRRWQELAGALDTNHFAKYLAMQVITWNWDGYAMFQNNYRIYHDPDSGRLFLVTSATEP